MKYRNNKVLTYRQHGEKEGIIMTVFQYQREAHEIIKKYVGIPCKVHDIQMLEASKAPFSFSLTFGIGNLVFWYTDNVFRKALYCYPSIAMLNGMEIFNEAKE